ncbi:MAG: four helix bundle protein [bacterium]
MKKKIDDLSIYSKSRELIKELYLLTNNNEHFKKDFSFKDQIRRAGISIISNIAEGFERDSDKEFHKFLGYSKGSAGEVRAQITVAYDIGYIDEEAMTSIQDKCNKLLRMMSSLRNYLIDSQ